jgi:hypothetical protein
VSRWNFLSACFAAKRNQRPRVCPREARKRKRSKMPPASIWRQRWPPTENDEAQLTYARVIRPRWTNPEWPQRMMPKANLRNECA